MSSFRQIYFSSRGVFERASKLFDEKFLPKLGLVSSRPRKPIHPDMTELLFPPFNKSTQPLTVEEVAEITRYHPRTIRRLARMERIPGAVQPFGKGGGWRFKRKQFASWWEAQGGGE